MADEIDNQHEFPTARWSVRQALVALRQMPFVFFGVLVATLILSAVSVVLLPDDPKAWGVNVYYQVAIENVLNAFIMTPMIIAIHRFVLLGEVTRFYLPNVFRRRFLHFFGLCLVYQAAILAVGLPLALFGTHAIPIIATIFLAIGCIWMGTRIILVFPAAAIDAPGASFRNAFSDSRGAGGPIFVTLLFIGLLIGVIEIGVRLLIEILVGATTIRGWLYLLNMSIAQVVTLAAFAVAASRIYQGLAGRLKVSAS
jgi:hypothetical protein